MPAAPQGVKSVELRFYGDLVDFVPGRRRVVDRTFDVAPSIKDVVEACGVPHPEVDLVLANGAPVAWDHRISDGEHISAFPRFRTLDITALSLVHVPPLAEPRFVLDGHLGTLARYLRLVGIDTLLPAGADDPELAVLSRDDGRALLTRDIELLKRNVVCHGYFVRATDPLLQCADVLRYFEVDPDSLRPFTRCTVCNGILEAVDSAAVEGEVPAGVLERHDRFARCHGCSKVFWKGSHVARLNEIITTLQRAVRA